MSGGFHAKGTVNMMELLVRLDFLSINIISKRISFKLAVNQNELLQFYSVLTNVSKLLCDLETPPDMAGHSL